MDSKILVQSAESSTPFKLLLTGGVIAISMLTDSDATCGDFAVNQSDFSFVQTDGIITPLLHASIYNPLCSIQSNDSTIKCEISCFNAAVCYSDTPTSVCKLLLTANGGDFFAQYIARAHKNGRLE